jgi:hypothetical protein
MKKELTGWQKILDGYPWFNCDGSFPIPAYSEFMPSPLVVRKPLGDIDYRIVSQDDPFGFNISEMEEEFEIKPGLRHTGLEITEALTNLGKGLHEHHIHGHGGQNLRDNPYWPAELDGKAGKLDHERYITLLPLMLSRTQDDKGRVIWTLFGNSVSDPEQAFWKSFYSAPGIEIAEKEAITFFGYILEKAYKQHVKDISSLYGSGFRILTAPGSGAPSWTGKYLISDDSTFAGVKYLLSFRPFSALPAAVREGYLNGTINLIPFPGSLVFWGMPGYNKLKHELPVMGQIPLLNLVGRNLGIGGLKVPQTGWFYEHRPGNEEKDINEALIRNTFHRTHRWERVHRYQDELNETTGIAEIVKALFSTDTNALGLYDKPLARNSQIWNQKFELLLDGPTATRLQLTNAEKTILAGGLFGYRFFSLPMRAGKYDIYWHRPLVSYISPDTGQVEICTDLISGYITAYRTDDRMMTDPVELWPRILKRSNYLSAVNDFTSHIDHFSHQTSLNIISLFEAWKMQNEKPLSESFAGSLLCIAKHKTPVEWLAELPLHSDDPEKGARMKEELLKIIDAGHEEKIPGSLTFSLTAKREFEERWWNDIKCLAHGEYVTKDNADVVTDEATLQHTPKRRRDLDRVGDYLIERHRKEIADAGMDGIAFCGELPFRWQTDFDFSIYGGWKGNQNESHHERNILVVIPGKNRKQAVVMGDHYDTAFMEDVYDKQKGGSGARLAANGADDNYSATSTILEAAPVFLKMSKEGRLERDIWLIHLTGEEFPSDCMGARNFCRSLIEKKLKLIISDQIQMDISDTAVAGVFIMDMIGHNRDNDQDVFQISPGKSQASLNLAQQAHLANMIWNESVREWYKSPERIGRDRGKRVTGTEKIPEISKFLPLAGEVRTQYNPYSSIFNTDGQIFSDVGLPVVLFMENYDINRTGYHDTKDTMENIDLDYGSAFAAIAIETVARVACTVT